MNRNWEIIVDDGPDATTYTINVFGQVLHLSNEKQLNGERQYLLDTQLIGFTKFRPRLEPVRVDQIIYTIDDLSFHTGLLVLNTYPIFKFRNQIVGWSKPVRHVIHNLDMLT